MAAAAAAAVLFEALDKDGDGKVSASELRGCMAAALGEEEAVARRRKPTTTVCWTAASSSG